MRLAMVIGLGIALGGTAMEVAGQVRVGVEVDALSALHRRPATFEPASGPPGTVVKLRGVDLPILAPLRVGVGALRFGFEEAGWVLSDDDGRFTLDVVIPEWAQRDVAHVFIVFDPYFAPLALSEVFHVTDGEGRVTREGKVHTAEGGCPTLLGADEVPYALAGDLSGFELEGEVVVEGKIAMASECGDGPAIHVLRIVSGPP